MGNCLSSGGSISNHGNGNGKAVEATKERRTPQRHVDNHPSKPNNNNTAAHDPLSFTYTTNTCALEYWEPVQLLGEGSISTIHLVRRRPTRVEIPYKERAEIMQRVKLGTGTTAGGAGAESITEQAVDAARDNHHNNNTASSKVYALKSIMKDYISNDRYLQEMRDEIHTMSQLQHANIIRVVEGYERKRHVYLIMEVCHGGDLTQVEGTTERHAKAVVRRILDAVAYMHQQNVVHRDCKYYYVLPW